MGSVIKNGEKRPRCLRLQAHCMLGVADVSLLWLCPRLGLVSPMFVSETDPASVSEGTIEHGLAVQSFCFSQHELIS